MTWRHVTPVVKFYLISGLVFGFGIACLGVWLVYIHSSGHTEFSLLGMSFKSENIGIAAIFLGSVVAIVSLRNVNRLLITTVNAKFRR